MHYEIPQSILDQLPSSILVKDQKQKRGPVFYEEDGNKYRIIVYLRYDDQCNNGHNTFSITADVAEYRSNVYRWSSGGCCHDAISLYIPKLAPFIKWHLVSSDGPMHYMANTIYHAGDKDHWGLRKGEFKPFFDKESGLPQWTLSDIHTAHSYPASATEPEPVRWVPWGTTGKGKVREFDYARSCAVWPEATDEQLSLPEEELAKLLIGRLPALMWKFKKDMETLGFIY